MNILSILYPNEYFFMVIFFQLIVVSKEMCGLKGAAKTDFSVSLNSFNLHITHISQLVSKMADSLHAVALSGHLLHTTAPENFIKGPLKVKLIVTISVDINRSSFYAE